MFNFIEFHGSCLKIEKNIDKVPMKFQSKK